MTTRRRFIAIVPAAGTALLATRAVQAQATAAVDPKDPQATALGYVTDTTKADKTKFPKHTPDQHCGNCQLFQGAATAEKAPCTLFQGKQVLNKAWCSAWTKKAG